MNRREFMKIIGLSGLHLVFPACPEKNHSLFPQLNFNRVLSQYEIQALYPDPYAPLKCDGAFSFRSGFSDYVDVNPEHPLSRGLVGGVVFGADGETLYIRRRCSIWSQW